jgi:death-on-curing protein
MIVWLDKALALAIHAAQLSEHGGRAGLRDERLLESALARPQQLYAYGDPTPDLADLAAALAYGIARNHPFLDGNKRTTAVCCETFIELNGASLEATDAELYELYMPLAEGKLSERQFARWLRERLRVAPRGEAHERRTPYIAKRRGRRTRASNARASR